MATITDIRANALQDGATEYVLRVLAWPDLATEVINELREADRSIDAERIATALAGAPATFGPDYYADGGDCWDESLWWINATPATRTGRIAELSEWAAESQRVAKEALRTDAGMWAEGTQWSPKALASMYEDYVVLRLGADDDDYLAFEAWAETIMGITRFGRH